jgi:hypothetical protein
MELMASAVTALIRQLSCGREGESESDEATGSLEPSDVGYDTIMDTKVADLRFRSLLSLSTYCLPRPCARVQPRELSRLAKRVEDLRPRLERYFSSVISLNVLPLLARVCEISEAGLTGGVVFCPSSTIFRTSFGQLVRAIGVKGIV